MFNDGWEALRGELLVSREKGVYHPTLGCLSYVSERHSHCSILKAVHFRSYDKAADWIKSGTIAEIQEALSNLAVGFSTMCIVPRA